MDKIEQRYRAYRGIAEKRSEKTQGWRSDLTTPYILQLVEGMIASMLDPKPTWAVQPRPDPGEPIEESPLGASRPGWRRRRSRRRWTTTTSRLKQRPFMQQDLIAGMTVAKVVWAYEARELNRLVADRDRGHRRLRRGPRQASPPPRRRSSSTVLRDGPSVIVRDVRDFFWPESAKSVDDAAWVIDRTWATFDELKAKQEAGLYRYVDELENAQNGQTSDRLHRARAELTRSTSAPQG